MPCVLGEENRTSKNTESCLPSSIQQLLNKQLTWGSKAVTAEMSWRSQSCSYLQGTGSGQSSVWLCSAYCEISSYWVCSRIGFMAPSQSSLLISIFNLVHRFFFIIHKAVFSGHSCRSEPSAHLFSRTSYSNPSQALWADEWSDQSHLRAG